MEMYFFAALLGLALGIMIGAVLGWLWASRDAAGAKQTVENLRLQLDEVVKERDLNREVAIKLAAVEAAQEERERAHQRQLEALETKFAEISTKVLNEAQNSFLKRADDRFKQSEINAEKELKTLLQPVETTLKRYEEGLKQVEKERVDQYASLREAVDLVRIGQSQVRDEARTLSTALRYAPKMRAALGEQSLQNVLEKAGLSPFADFKTEVSVEGSDGRIRPDVVVRLPGERQLIIDAKCSLNAYVDACNEVDEEKRKKLWEKHASSIKQHVQQLGSKGYWAQFGDSTDYVIMYIPGEQFLTAALEQDDGLWQWAFDKRVILATPQNLIAIVGTVATMWKRQQLNDRAEEIAVLGKELHSRLATMSEHMARVGKNLSTANNAYNQMVGSFESQVLTQAKRFDTLGAGSAKALETPPMVELAPRPLTKLASKPSNDEPPQIAAE
jgi:DNA recombination protein RmuC